MLQIYFCTKFKTLEILMEMMNKLSIVAGLCLVSVIASADGRISQAKSPMNTAMRQVVKTTVGDDNILPSKYNTNQETWMDKRHSDTKSYLDKTAHKMNKWFGATNPSDPARASLRVMMNIHWSDEGTTVKPRLRGKLKLPALEDRFSFMFGDEYLDVEREVGISYDEHVIKRTDRHHDKRKAREQNSFFGLRWSKFQEGLGVETDIDLGTRSDDVFLKIRAEKKWRLPKNVGMRFEQVYRFGSKSKHQTLSTLELSQPQSDTRTLTNRTQLKHTHQGIKESNWGNYLYQQHDWQGKYGRREFRYGIYTGGGNIKNKKAHLNVYGPYVSYRQPIWREWLFLQGDVSYYNNKVTDRKHQVGALGRVEVVF